MRAVAHQGGRAHTEELVFQGKVTDQWNFYQAKNIRMHEMEVMVDLLGSVTTVDKEKTELLREKYQKEVERYQSDKDSISDKAKELEKEGDLVRKRADCFDAGEGVLEIALVICSLTLLTNKKIFWFAGMIIGAVGAAASVAGFLVR